MTVVAFECSLCTLVFVFCKKILQKHHGTNLVVEERLNLIIINESSILTSFTTLATEFDKKANKLYSIFKLSKKKRKEDCAGSITTGTIYFLKCSLWCKLPFCLPCYFSATWVQPPFLYPHHCHVTLYAPDLVCLGKMGKPHSTDCMTSEKQGPVVLNFSSDNARRLVTSEGL